MTTNKKTTTEKKAHPSDLLMQYVLGCLDKETEGGKQLDTEKEQIQNVASAFIEEFNYEANRKRYPNRTERIAEWLKGLPNTICFAYYNSDIIKLADSFGYDVSTEKRQDSFLDKWFSLVAFKLVQIAERNGVSFGEV